MSLNLETIDNSILLFIRSKEVVQLSDGLNSNMKINLQAPISRNNALQDIHVQLNSCEIPHSFYNFSSNLNNINLFMDGSSSLVLTSQHYDIYELIAFITAASFPYSATFDSQTNKITLTNTDTTSHTINFSNDSSQKLATALGFNNVDTVVGSGASLTSQNSVNLNTIHSIFVHTNLSFSNVITTTEGNLRNIVQKIPVKTMFSEIINYSPTENAQFSSVTNAAEIRSIDISLRDQNDILIDFNQVNYELSLLFEIHTTNTPVNNSNNDNARRSGRRSMLTQPLSPIQENNQQNNQENNQENEQQNRVNNQTIPLTRTISRPSIPLTELGFYSQPKPEPIIELPLDETSKEDKLLSDKFNHKLQEKLLDLDVLDEII